MEKISFGTVSFLLVIFAIVWSFSFGLNGISILCKVGVYD